MLSRFLNFPVIFFIASFQVILPLNFPTLAQRPLFINSTSSRILENANSNKKMNWGLRKNSSPISYQDKNDVWQGFCTNLIDLLDKYLKENGFLENDVNIVKYPIGIERRFEYTRYPDNNKLNLVGECGSDSIRNDIQGIKFSTPFFITKTVLLIRTSHKKELSLFKKDLAYNSNNSKNHPKLKIGVTKSSITYDRVKNFFNTVPLIEILPVEGGRANVINALLTEKIDALASDEILLRSILKDLESSKSKQFYIDSEFVISLEGYGLILPQYDQTWINIIERFFLDQRIEIQALVREHIENSPELVAVYSPTPSPSPNLTEKPVSYNKEQQLLALIVVIIVSGLANILFLLYIVKRKISRLLIKPKTSKFSESYALLIGVGESAYTPLSLPVTVKDVKAIHQVLVDPNFCAYPNDSNHVKLLYDKEATRSNILAGLNWLKEQAQTKPTATVIVYYSGHGWLNNNNNCYYLLQHDINPFDLEGSSLSAEDFTNALRQIKCDRLLVIIDSCHAAGMATAKTPSDFEEIPIPKTVIDNIRQGKGRVVFTSCQGEESSWIRPDGKMSIYTYHLIEALKGKSNQANEKFIKISHLMKYLSEKVPTSARYLCKKEQNPYFSFEAEDFPIALLKGRSDT